MTTDSTPDVDEEVHLVNTSSEYRAVTDPAFVSCCTCGIQVEYDDSYPGKEGDVCETCYDEETYDCGLCGECESDVYRGYVVAFSHLIAGESGALRAGLYEVLRWPYYINEFFCEHIVPGSVRRIGDGPAWLANIKDQTLSPAYHVCADCSAEALFCRRTRSGLWAVGGKRYRTKRLARRPARRLMAARAAAGSPS